MFPYEDDTCCGGFLPAEPSNDAYMYVLLTSVLQASYPPSDLW